MKKKPNEIAKTLYEEYKKLDSNLVDKVEAHPSGYLNFFADWPKLNELILTESIKPNYGFQDIGKNTKVVVEHTSVNPNKAIHVGHIRNIIIGDTISRILERTNHDVRILNYVDDSGLQVADIIVGFTKLNFPEDPPVGKKFDQYCGDEVYVRTTSKYDVDSQLQEERKKILQEIEKGDSEIASLAKHITRKVLDEQLETCWNLSVYYDCINFESEIVQSGLWAQIFEKLKKMNLIRFEKEGKNAGCWVIPSEDEEDKVLVRSNGTATYIAKDIPYAAWKLALLNDPFNYRKYPKEQQGRGKLWETTLEKTNEEKQDFSGDRVITVIDSRQSRLQKIVTQLMSSFKSEDDAYMHLGYESVTLSPQTAKKLGIDTGGKQAQMSGRKGLYVNADSLYELLRKKTYDETKKRNSDMTSELISEISHDVAVGTIRYEMIKQDLDKMIVFDLEKATSLEGDTASYIQYTSARSSRILEKADFEPDFNNAKYDLLADQHEKNLVRQIGLFSKFLKDSADNLSPKVIAKYSHDMAVNFNSFYENNKVLDIGDKNLENVRLCLTYSFRSTLSKSLEILGIVSPERM